MNAVVDDGVHLDGDGVPGEDLLRGHVKGECPQVHDLHLIQKGVDEDDAGAPGSPLLDLAKAEDDGALILLEMMSEQMAL